MDLTLLQLENDGDGKSDLVVANYLSHTISIIRNISSSGNLTTGSFAPKIDFTTGLHPSSIAIGDLDSDGKLDLAVANFFSDNISIFRNTSTTGTLNLNSFEPKVDFPANTKSSSITIGDLNGDGKFDLAVANFFSNNISILQNTSTRGSLTTSSFAPKVDYTTGISPYAITNGDLDGDGKSEIAVLNIVHIQYQFFVI